MSRSLTCWSPTLARVPLLMPKPIWPEPKFDRSAAANPARIAMPMAAIIPVPILDLETRRKKVSMGSERAGGRSALGSGLACIKPRGYGRRQEGVRDVIEEARRRQLENARGV